MENKSFWNLSVFSLIAANFVPFFGVLFWGWSLFSVMFFYWSENIAIGLYNVLKMNRAKKIDQEQEKKVKITYLGKAYYSNKKLDYIFLFISTYGIFTAAHGFSVFSLFGPIDITIYVLMAGLIALFASHGISYFENFINKKEYEKLSPADLFFKPYKRVIVMHITIAFAASIVKILNLPIISLLVLAALKTIIDFHSHKLEHKNI